MTINRKKGAEERKSYDGNQTVDSHMSAETEVEGSKENWTLDEFVRKICAVS